MLGTSELTSVVEQQLLLQLGGRLKRARIRQGLTTVEMASRVGLSRMTLRSIEAGEPTPTMGSYLRVMGVLGVSGDLALLAAEVDQAPARRKTTRTEPKAVESAVSDRGHELQDLQSLVLHQEAVRLMKKNPALIQKALDTLDRWRARGSSRSDVLWDEWSVILHRRSWRRALANTERSRELRQASPLTTVLPASTRKRILDEVQRLRGAASSKSP
jgi:transcriptional regulator with XRE-family HTH domain